MTYSKLCYIRELKKERITLEEKRKKEYQKRTRNSKKLNRIDKTLKEVNAELYKTEIEIREWLKIIDLPSDIKAQCIDYYVRGCSYYDNNFFRYVKTQFGENH